MLDSSLIIIILCSTVILSYLFSLISLKTRIPSVLLLLFTGMALKYVVSQLGIHYAFPPAVIEFFGTIGLIMIILEAGLDLRVNNGTVSLIRNSFFSASLVMILSVVLVGLTIMLWLKQPVLNSVVYALPFSIISGAIVIPSLQHLTHRKREFLVYESSFSDILGILLFNYIITEHALSFLNISLFFVNLFIAFAISLLITFFLLFLITRSKVNVKFFLIFAILVLLYVTGKLINLPSLIIILVFGLMVANWDKIRFNRLIKLYPPRQIIETRELLYSITAESSFLIRTFFFILFGYSIKPWLLVHIEVILIGSVIVVIMLLVRYFYLKLFVKTNILPELFYMPRGLITILLFYKIPPELQLSSFNEGILFFVVIVTSLIMMFGALFYKAEKGVKAPDEIYEQG